MSLLKKKPEKKLLSSSSQLDDEREKDLLKELELDTDEFIQQYHLQRLLQLKQEQERRHQLNRFIIFSVNYTI